jgi:hypothetical protein
MMGQGKVGMASPVKTRRNQMISSTVDRIRLIEKDKGVTREALEDIRAGLLELAAHTELFPEEDFVIERDDKGNFPIYRLAEDDDHRFALYMSTSIGAKDVPPHDHTTWAVIVSVQGTEENRFYEKIGDYSVPGKGQIRQCGGTTVRPALAYASCQRMCTVFIPGTNGRRSSCTCTGGPSITSRTASRLIWRKAPTKCSRPAPVFARHGSPLRTCSLWHAT